LAASAIFNKNVFAQDAKISMKMGGNLSTNHPAMLAMEKACERITRESNGGVTIRFYSNLQLGAEPAMHSQLRSGAIEMMTTSGLILQTLVPLAGLSGMAFAFKDYQQVWAALDGDLGAAIRANMEKFGIYGFPKNMDNGFRHVTTSTKPIKDIGDLKNLKIRVPPSPVWVKLFTALGASPTSINLNELYTSLQTKLVDAQECATIGRTSVDLTRPRRRDRKTAKRRRAVERRAGGRPPGERHSLEPSRNTAVPRSFEQGRLLRRLEDAIWAGSLDDSRTIRRDAVMSG
jgi:TRAP-type C4-dicarboxylate transport system substrate-binding protein